MPTDSPSALGNPVNPGASSSVDLYNDSGNSGGVLPFSRIKGSGFIDQNCTIFVATRPTLTASWRVQNGAGAGDAIAANQTFNFDYDLRGRFNRVYITTVTAPTVFDVSVMGAQQGGKP